MAIRTISCRVSRVIRTPASRQKVVIIKNGHIAKRVILEPRVLRGEPVVKLPRQQSAVDPRSTSTQKLLCQVPPERLMGRARCHRRRRYTHKECLGLLTELGKQCDVSRFSVPNGQGRPRWITRSCPFTLKLV